MRRLRSLALLLLLLPILAACAGGEQTEAEQPTISGPAFVWFYSDN